MPPGVKRTPRLAEPRDGGGEVVDPETDVVQRRLVDLRALRGSIGCIRSTSTAERADAGDGDVLVDVLALAAERRRRASSPSRSIQSRRSAPLSGRRRRSAAPEDAERALGHGRSRGLSAAGRCAWSSRHVAPATRRARASPTAAPKATVHFRSLGCPKNRVDTEVMLGTLALDGYALAERLEDADVVGREHLLVHRERAARSRSTRSSRWPSCARAGGCARSSSPAVCPQRYGGELAKELPEVDAFVGTGAFPRIAEILDDALAGRSRRRLRRVGAHPSLRRRDAAAARRPEPQRLREDRRGLRPHLRLLRDPGHPRQVPEPHARLAGRARRDSSPRPACAS